MPWGERAQSTSLISSARIFSSSFSLNSLTSSCLSVAKELLTKDLRVGVSVSVSFAGGGGVGVLLLLLAVVVVVGGGVLLLAVVVVVGGGALLLLAVVVGVVVVVGGGVLLLLAVVVVVMVVVAGQGSSSLMDLAVLLRSDLASQNPASTAVSTRFWTMSWAATSRTTSGRQELREKKNRN